MSSKDRDDWFYKAHLERICQKYIPNRVPCLVKGYHGSGKTMFLRHIQTFCQDLRTNQLHFESVDFSRELALPDEKAKEAKKRIIDILDANANRESDDQITIYFLFA